MTIVAVLSCDGHRHGQPCRGAHPLPPGTPATVPAIRAAGWHLMPGGLLLCPSLDHEGVLHMGRPVTKPPASDMTHRESRHDDTTDHDHDPGGKTAGQEHDPIFRDLDAPDPPVNIFLSPQDQTHGE